MKPRISAYVSDHIAQLLKAMSQRPGSNQSAIIEAALRLYLDPQGDNKLDAAMVRRLDHMSTQISKLDRDMTIVVETLALFVRTYLTITPPLTADNQDSSNALGHKRFEFFIAQVGKRLGSSQNLVGEVLDNITLNNPDLFGQEASSDQFSSHSSLGGAPARMDKTLKPRRCSPYTEESSAPSGHPTSTETKEGDVE